MHGATLKKVRQVGLTGANIFVKKLDFRKDSISCPYVCTICAYIFM